MNATVEDLTLHLLDRLRHVRRNLGFDDDTPVDPQTALGDVLDSMAMVEFLAVLAEDCATKPVAIEECVGRRFGTVAELAQAMKGAAIACGRSRLPSGNLVEAVPLGKRDLPDRPRSPEARRVYLAATAVRLPDAVQPAAELDAALERPTGWFEAHAGVRSRRLWANEDLLTAAAEAGRSCLERAGLLVEEVGALLVTSEALPLLAGLAAALHHRLNLPPRTTALEIGGACTGFLAALWTGQRLLPTTAAVLVIAIEAPSRYLRVGPGPSGEAAALFGDGAAACVLGEQQDDTPCLTLRDIVLGADGSAGSLVQPVLNPAGAIELHMDGPTLASRALAAMAEAVYSLLPQHGLSVADLRALVAHGGNGRMPALLARQLGLPADRVWSATPDTGNLGAASLPAAWALQGPCEGPVVWVGVGAGLTWGAALFA